MIDYGLVFATGLLASFHCVGMCGPIVLAYSTVGMAGGGTSGGGGLLVSHLAYNIGRILAYTLVGSIAGLIGAGLGSLKVFAPYISLAGGGMMIVLGLAMLGLFLLPQSSRNLLPAPFRKAWGSLLSRRSYSSRLCLGCLTPLLPCGILYAMLVKAGTAGTPLGGALTMAAFGAGMTPALVAVGSLSSLLSLTVRKYAERLAAVSILLMGIALVLRGLHIPIIPMSH